MQVIWDLAGVLARTLCPPYQNGILVVRLDPAGPFHVWLLIPLPLHLTLWGSMHIRQVNANVHFSMVERGLGYGELLGVDAFKATVAFTHWHGSCFFPTIAGPSQYRTFSADQNRNGTRWPRYFHIHHHTLFTMTSLLPLQLYILSISLESSQLLRLSWIRLP